MAQWLARLQQWPHCQQGLGSESHLRPVELFVYNKVSLFNKQTPMLTSVPCAPPPPNSSKAVATRAEIYSRSDEAKLNDVSCLDYADVGQLSDAFLLSW